MNRPNLGALAFCLLSGWSISAWADVAPLPDASAGDAGETCTLTVQNEKWDNSCSRCTDADGGLAALSACESRNASAGKGKACSTTEDGSTVEIYCEESAASRAEPGGCAIQPMTTAGGWGLWAALVGVGFARMFRRRRCRL
jgi:hypothetical protein